MILKTFVLVVLCSQVSYATTYYVSTATGASDSNSGSLTSPWRSLNASVAKLHAGDVLFVRGGTYVEKVWIYNSGTSANPITISAYSGEFPIIDGENVIPTGNYSPLLGLFGNYISVSGFEIKNTTLGNNARGVALSGHHNTVSKLNVHHIYANGILIQGDNNIVEDSQLWQSCYSNVNGTQTGWASGLSAARGYSGTAINGITSNAIIRRNIVFNNWGEGLSTYQATGTIIEDNIVYDNWARNIYVSDATNITVQRNMIYISPNYVPRNKSLNGISLFDEISNGSTVPHSANMVIINNLIFNGSISGHNYNETAAGSVGLINVKIVNNTLINSKLSTSALGNSNSQICNNIFIGTGNSIPSNDGITFSNNAWSATPPSTAAGTGDFTGDPLVAMTGSTNAGALTADFFKILASSPARDHGIVVSGITEDYFRTVRGSSPDIGAHEFSTTVGLSTLDSPLFRLFPNPVTNNLTIEMPDFQNSNQVQIFNATGILMKIVNISSNRQNICLDDLASGIYLARSIQLPELSMKFIKR